MAGGIPSVAVSVARAIAGAACTMLLLAAAPARAESRDEFWPELNAYLKLNERTRVFLLAAFTQAEKTPGPGGPTRYQDSLYGAHLEYSLTPVLRAGLRDEDWARNRYLWIRVGYVYTRSNGDAETTDRFRENRGVFELNGRTLPLAAGLEVVARARLDARDRNGTESQRYRIRLGLEKSFDVNGRVVVPYVDAESFYDTRYNTWNRQLYRVGAEIGIAPAWRIEPYLGLQKDSRSEPSTTWMFGLALKYYR